jgi:hypothetical protein
MLFASILGVVLAWQAQPQLISGAEALPMSWPAYQLLPQAQATFSPQESYGIYTLWRVSITGAKADVPTAVLIPLAAAHQVAILTNTSAADLLAGVTKKTVIGRLLRFAAYLSAASSIGAEVKADVGTGNRVAGNVALGTAALGVITGVGVPLLQKDEPTPPAPELIGASVRIGGDGTGSAEFWSRQSGQIFTVAIP